MTQRSKTHREEYQQDPYNDPHHDPYFIREKPPEPALCSNCGVSYERGRFVWLTNRPKDAHRFTCPACQRIRDHYEGGVVTLEGPFVLSHREELIHLAHNTEQAEKGNRPLERIMSVDDHGDRIVLKTTYEHLAKRIGDAIQRAYKGNLRVQFQKGDKYARVWWSFEDEVRDE